MESCVSEEQPQHEPIEDAPSSKDAPSEEDAAPGEDEPMGDAPGKGAPSWEDAPSGEDGPPGENAPSEEDEPMGDAPGKGAPSCEDTPSCEDAPSGEDGPPGENAPSEEDEPMEDAPPGKGAPSCEDTPSGENAPPGEDRPSEGDEPMWDAPPGEFDESEAEGDLDPNYLVESDHSSSSSSCPDLYTDDEEGKNNPQSEWTSKSRRVWLPTNAETHRYVPSSKGWTPGPTRYAISWIDSLESSFDLFLTPEIIDIIVKMTNLNRKRAKGPKWQVVDVTDVKAYIGLLILAGVYRSKGEPFSSLWEDQTGRPIFRATMSYGKFIYIGANLRFEDKKIRSARLKKDKLAPIRVIWDMWTKRLQMLFNPGEDVCVGEQFFPFRGKCEFLQYTRRNPARYGIKIWFTADVATSYAWNCQVYTRKGLKDTRDLSQGEHDVLKLTENLQRVTVTCDTVLTYSLVQELLKRKVAMVGAIKRIKPELPPKLLRYRQRAIYSSIFAFTKATTAVSYIPKRGKNLLVLSSRHRDGAVSDDDKKRPVIVTDYNRCKGAVDNLDQALRTYSCRRKVSHWTHALFCNMIDVSAFNSFVIYTAVKPNWNSDRRTVDGRRLFLEELGKKLVSGEMMRRASCPQGPASAAANMVHGVKVSAANVAPITEPPFSKKRRAMCWMCPDKKRKIDTPCIKCAQFTCKDHRIECCRSCWIN